MLIKGISSLKFCAYVGQESREDVSREILGLEEHKLMEQYQMATGGSKTNEENFKNRAPPLFAQPNKKDKARIMQLLKVRNEKRKIIKLLERKNINSNKTDSLVSARVEEALQKILQQELQSLYQEVKNIIFSPQINETAPAKPVVGKRPAKNKWPLKKLDHGDAKLSAVLTEEVDSLEDAAYEMDEQAVIANGLNLTADGIADDTGRIDHNHENDTSKSDESSFSSSEEAMLHCRGVLLSQPLVPENQCSNETDPTRNVIKYVVEEDGYYYFIFSSANEKVILHNIVLIHIMLNPVVMMTTDTESANCEIRVAQDRLQRDGSNGYLPQHDGLPLPTPFLLLRATRGGSSGSQ